MDVALREIAEYEEVKDMKPEESQVIFNPQWPHAYAVIRIYNTGRCPIWIKSKDNVLNYAPARPTIGVTSEYKDGVYVEVTRGSKHNSRQQKDVIFRYRLNPKLLCKGCAVYLKTLGVYVSIDRRFLEDMVIPEDTLLMDRLRDLVDRSLNQMKQCPISVIISDPTGRLRYIYAVLDRCIYRIPVLHTRRYGKTCVVRFAGVDQMDSDAIYDFTLDEMLEAFDKREAFTPKIGQYKLMLFGTLEDAQEVLSKINTEQTRAVLGVTAREKEEARLAFTSKIESLERENATLRKQLEMLTGVAKIREDEQKREHSTKVQTLQVQKEESKVAKANVDYAAAEVGRSSTMMKAAAVVIPALLGCIGLCIAKIGVLGGGLAISSVSDGLISNLADGCWGFLGTLGAMVSPISIAKKTWGAVKSLASAVGEGIASIGSWISSWF